MTHIRQRRGGKKFNYIENASDYVFCSARVIFCNPYENFPEVVQRFFIEDDFHIRVRRNCLRASASVMYFGFFFARRRRTSATCSSVSRYGFLSCFSITESTCMTSFCRSSGHVKTRSRTSFTCDFVMSVQYHMYSRRDIGAKALATQ